MLHTADRAHHYVTYNNNKVTYTSLQPEGYSTKGGKGGLRKLKVYVSVCCVVGACISLESN